MKKTLFYFALLFTFLMSGTAAWADDTSLGRTPEGVYPVHDADIVMQSEYVTVNLQNGKVECRFVFSNQGEAKTILMGFPARSEYDDSGDRPFDRNELRNFTASVDGKKIVVTTEDGNISDFVPGDAYPKYTKWFTFSVTLTGHGTTEVINTYDVGFTADSMGGTYAGYILKTGAFWKGSIGYAKVEFILGDVEPWNIQDISPVNMRFEDDALVWERREFEPLYDLNLTYYNWIHGEEAEETFNQERLAELAKREKIFKEAVKLSAEAEFGQLAKMQEMALKDNDEALAVYVRGLLPKEKQTDFKTEITDISIKEYQSEGAGGSGANGALRDYLIRAEVIGMDVVKQELSVSHSEEGEKVTDYVFDSKSCIAELRENVDYEITYKIANHEDVVISKTIDFAFGDKLKAPPEKTAVSPEPVSTAVTAEPLGTSEQTYKEEASDNLQEIPQTGLFAIRDKEALNPDEAHATAPIWQKLLLAGIAFVAMVTAAFLAKKFEKKG